eukprot:TRINITY_DN170_c1_g1_i2.p1 TRINITY_DN170_c1_g1~~TRINITY_DN170_c1_g1_i2.p1  ORF type:complete len:397 (-),score=166.66 TRINITY_DN170_c1_g1_i2:128-1318(-)
MSELNIDALAVKKNEYTINQVDEKLVEMQNGCICCTLREDLLVEVSKLAKENRFDYLVIESTGVSEPLPVAETFTFDIPGYNNLSDISKLDTMVTMIDLYNFDKNLKSIETAYEKYGSSDGVAEEDERSVSFLLIEQVEFSNVIILNKADLVEESVINRVKGIVRKLNTEAKIYATTRSEIPLKNILNTDLFDFESASLANGWLKELRGEHVPETEEYGISSFVYKRRKPFHPQKLEEFLINRILPENVIRSKGTCWIACDYINAYIWENAGLLTPDIILEDEWYACIDKKEWEGTATEWEEMLKDFVEPHGDRKNEIVFIATELDKKKIEDLLDDILLTDEEFNLGPTEWEKYPNPFVEIIEVEEEEEEEGQGEAVPNNENDRILGEKKKIRRNQ